MTKKHCDLNDIEKFLSDADLHETLLILNMVQKRLSAIKSVGGRPQQLKKPVAHLKLVEGCCKQD